jgi:hypothetical protein
VQRDVSTWQSIREHRALTDKLTFFPFFLSFFAKKSSMSGSSGAACVDSATCAHGCGCGCETLTAQSVRTGADARVRTTAVRMVKCQASFNLAGELSWEVEVAHMCVCYIGKGAIIGQVLCPQRMRCWLQHTVLDIAGGCGTLAMAKSAHKTVGRCEASSWCAGDGSCSVGWEVVGQSKCLPDPSIMCR